MQFVNESLWDGEGSPLAEEKGMSRMERRMSREEEVDEPNGKSRVSRMGRVGFSDDWLYEKREMTENNVLFTNKYCLVSSSFFMDFVPSF